MGTSYVLSLADGSYRQIMAGDKGAVPIVETLVRAMKLVPGGAAEHSLLVVTGRERETFSMTGSAMVCRFPVPENKDELVSRAMEVSLAIAYATQRRGGVLVHGGLAEYEGSGVILAAPGGTGKSTALSRLPRPWRSRSDDAALIVRDPQGNYFTHPWPTWSLFYENGPGGQWNITVAMPLKALYFLFQSKEDDLEELIPAQAAAMLIESVEQANRVFDRRLSYMEIQENHLRQFSIVSALTAGLPAYRLRLSLTGEFWKLIEGSIAERERTYTSPHRGREGEAPAEVVDIQVAQSGVVFSGNSMRPTLKEPDYLEVCPYNGTRPRRGDVVYFRDPRTGMMVVHRIMALGSNGCRTKGDNNPQHDPGHVPLSALEGRVVAARGSGRKCRVRGGATGMMDYYYALAFRRSRVMAGRLYRMFSRYCPLMGIMRSLARNRVEFRFVLFGKMPLEHMKIFANDRCVGQYVRGAWHIGYPWRLLVDPAKIAAAAKRYETAKAQWLEGQSDLRNGS
jgi:SynChlorMet cassette protein ScmC